MDRASMSISSTEISSGSEFALGTEKGRDSCPPRRPDPQNRTSVVAMIAIQRSGTHLLREILNSNSRVAMLPEPFNRDTQSFCWHKYIATLPKEKYPPNGRDELERLLDGFIDAIDQDIEHNSDVYGGRKRSRPMIGLDVKYNQLKSISPAYADLRLRPFLLDYFSARRARIVHLVRRNLVHTAISAIIANIRKVWQNYDGTSIGGQYCIPINTLFNYVRWIEEERTAFESLAGDLIVHTCYYEDLVDDLKKVGWFGRFRHDTTALSRLAAFLRIPNRFRNYGYIRKVINRPYKELLENYDEVLAAIEDSPLSAFASTL